MENIRVLTVNIKVADLVHVPLTVAAINSLCMRASVIDLNLEVMSEPLPTGATQAQVDELGVKITGMIKHVQDFDSTIPKL